MIALPPIQTLQEGTKVAAYFMSDEDLHLIGRCKGHFQVECDQTRVGNDNVVEHGVLLDEAWVRLGLGGGMPSAPALDKATKEVVLLVLCPVWVDEQFGHMIRAFSYGAPPHGGIAPGVDRIVMIYADENNLREITAFPKNQRAQDLCSGAPGEVSLRQLEELYIKLDLPEE